MMKSNYQPLAQTDNGELVVASRAGWNHLGIKGLYKDTHFVVLLCPQIDGVPGPFTYVDIENQWSVLALGKDWVVDFDPINSVNFNVGSKAPLGAMLLSENGPSVVSRNESGRHTCSINGELGPDTMQLPCVAEWRILIKQPDNQFRELLCWPSSLVKGN